PQPALIPDEVHAERSRGRLARDRLEVAAPRRRHDREAALLLDARGLTVARCHELVGARLERRRQAHLDALLHDPPLPRTPPPAPCHARRRPRPPPAPPGVSARTASMPTRRMRFTSVVPLMAPSTDASSTFCRSCSTTLETSPSSRPASGTSRGALSSLTRT